MHSKTILLIEDDISLRQAIETFLKRLGYPVLAFDHVEAALNQVNQELRKENENMKMDYKKTC